MKLPCFSYVALALEAEGVIALELREGFFLGHKMDPNPHSLTSKSFCLNYKSNLLVKLKILAFKKIHCFPFTVVILEFSPKCSYLMSDFLLT